MTGPIPPPSDPWSAQWSTSSAAPQPAADPTVPQPTVQQPSVPPPAAPAPVAAGDAGPVIVQIGELAVTSSTVHTPAGDIPLRGSTWHVSDHWLTEQKIPTWALVMAVVGFCVVTVLSLLFLLVKETVYRGTVQITITNGARQYVARLPVTTQAEVQQIYQQVNYVRSLAAI